MTGRNGKEELLMSPETIDRIRTMHEMFEEVYPSIQEIPRMNVLLSTIAAAQTSMSMAASSMAETNKKAEDRYARLEDKLQDANDRASGKFQIPIISHYLILGGTVLITVLVVLYVHNQSLDASLTSVKVGNHAQ